MNYSLIIISLLAYIGTDAAIIRPDITCDHNGQSYLVGEEFYADMCMKCRCAIKGKSIQTQLNCKMVSKCDVKKNIPEHGCYFGSQHIINGQEIQVNEILRCACNPDTETTRAKCKLHFADVDGNLNRRKPRFLSKYKTPAPPSSTTKGNTHAPPPFTTKVPPLPGSTAAPPTPAVVTVQAHGSTKSPPPPVLG